MRARLPICMVAALAAPPAPASADWPRAWFEPARTASQLGIRTFSQSPYFDEPRHAALPPLAERLPDDPVVVVPLAGDGVYGGKARIVSSDRLTFPNVEPPLTIAADMRTVLPNLAQSWTVSADGRRTTLALRPGLKWSDGEPLTSDDFLFVFNDLLHNEEFAPIPDGNVAGGRAVKVDQRVFYYEFERPNPLFVNLLAQYGDTFYLAAHFYRDFHPRYVDREELAARLDALGLINWTTFVNACRGGAIKASVDAPTMAAHRMVERAPAFARYERNPYYFKVDPRGRQLPYIDAVESLEAGGKELIAAMASTGQLDFAGYELRTQDIPLLKLGERAGDIRVHVWERLHASDVVIQPNYNHRDPRLRALYWDVRFRRALSLAIHREEMNQIIYFGRGTPRQVTAHPSSVFYDPAFASAYARHDPRRANALLDEMGLRDADGDGLRDHPDGSRLTITLEFIDWETPKRINLELVRAYWREVGIDLRLKEVDGGLQAARAQSGAMQMTAWHADRVTDILLPLEPDWWVPRRAEWHMAMWNQWARWHQTGGRLGEEPPPAMKRLQAWAEEMRTTTDPASRLRAGRSILASHAENVWNIGVVGLAPHPVVVSRRLRGVPRRAIWGWDNRWTLAYHPSTWFFEERKERAD